MKNECEGFIGVSRQQETDESTRVKAECFYFFEVSGYPDEARSTSFWYSLLNKWLAIIIHYCCFVLVIDNSYSYGM